VGTLTATECVRCVDMTVRSVVLPDESEVKNDSDKRRTPEAEFGRGVVKKERDVDEGPLRRLRHLRTAGFVSGIHTRIRHFHIHTSSNATSFRSRVIGALPIPQPQKAQRSVVINAFQRT